MYNQIIIKMDPAWQIGQILFMLASSLACLIIASDIMTLYYKFNLLQADHRENVQDVTNRMNNLEKTILHTQNRLSGNIAQTKRRYKRSDKN